MTDFGKVVKTTLINRDKPMKWLVEQVKTKTELYFDAAYLTKILNGKCENPKITAAIKEILNI